MPREKIGTILDQQLLRRARLFANREKKNLNQVLEEALAQYLAQKRHSNQKRVVRSTQGHIPAEPNLVQTILEESFIEV